MIELVNRNEIDAKVEKLWRRAGASYRARNHCYRTSFVALHSSSIALNHCPLHTDAASHLLLGGWRRSIHRVS